MMHGSTNIRFLLIEFYDNFANFMTQEATGMPYFQWKL